MRTPSLEKFKLEKVFVLEGGKYDMRWNYENVSGAEVNRVFDKRINSIVPDPELTDIFLKMTPIVAKLWGSGWIRELMKREGFDPTEQQLKMSEDIMTEVQTGIRVIGVELSGKEDTAGVNIKAEIKLPNGDKTVWKSPRIYFIGQSLGVESLLEDYAESLERECWCYIYDDKKAELEAFASEPNADNVIEMKPTKQKKATK